jgi:hypothetical protein
MNNPISPRKGRGEVSCLERSGFRDAIRTSIRALELLIRHSESIAGCSCSERSAAKPHRDERLTSTRLQSCQARETGTEAGQAHICAAFNARASACLKQQRSRNARATSGAGQEHQLWAEPSSRRCAQCVRQETCTQTNLVSKDCTSGPSSAALEGALQCFLEILPDGSGGGALENLGQF